MFVHNHTRYIEVNHYIRDLPTQLLFSTCVHNFVTKRKSALGATWTAGFPYRMLVSQLDVSLATGCMIAIMPLWPLRHRTPALGFFFPCCHLCLFVYFYKYQYSQFGFHFCSLNALYTCTSSSSSLSFSFTVLLFLHLFPTDGCELNNLHGWWTRSLQMKSWELVHFWSR